LGKKRRPRHRVGRVGGVKTLVVMKKQKKRRIRNPIYLGRWEGQRFKIERRGRDKTTMVVGLVKAA